MKHPKNYYPVIAAAALATGALIPAGSGEEKTSVVPQIQMKAVPQDPVVDRINEEIILPLNQQAKRQPFFSRRGPTSTTNYQLVETTGKTGETTGNERQFQVMNITTRLGSKNKPQSSVFLEIRSGGKSGDFLVRHEDAWVDASDHPFLKLLPKAKAISKITP